MVEIIIAVCILAVTAGMGISIAKVAYAEKDEWRGRFYNVSDANVHLAKEMKKLRNDLAELEQKYSWACPICGGTAYSDCRECRGRKRVWLDTVAGIQKTLAKLPGTKEFGFAKVALLGVLDGTNGTLDKVLYSRETNRENVRQKRLAIRKKRSKKS